MIKDWKVWEKIRRYLEQQPKDYSDMEMVCQYLFSWALGIAFSIIAIVCFATAAVVIARFHEMYVAAALLMFSALGVVFMCVYAQIMAQFKDHPKYRRLRK